MRLIGKSAGQRHIDGVLALPQPAGGGPHPQRGLIGMRRDEVFPPEGADQMGPAETGHTRQFLKPDLFGKMRSKIIPGAAHRAPLRRFRPAHLCIAMAAKKCGEQREHAFLALQSLTLFQRHMGNAKGPGHRLVADQLPVEGGNAVEGAARHILQHIAVKGLVGIDHPVAVTALFRCAVMHLTGVDKVKIARLRIFAAAANARQLAAGIDGAD